MKNKHTMTLGRLWELFWYQICIVPRLYTDLNLSETNKKEISSKHRSIYKKKNHQYYSRCKANWFFYRRICVWFKKNNKSAPKEIIAWIIYSLYRIAILFTSSLLFEWSSLVCPDRCRLLVLRHRHSSLCINILNIEHNLTTKLIDQSLPTVNDND